MREKAEIRRSLEKISTIPTLPSVIDQIARLLQNPQTTAEEVGKAITTDPALASKVLKLVNSAFYGFPGKIGTITHAIVILGFSTVKNVVLTASIFDFFKSRNNMHPDFDMKKFWIHSLASGAASQAIAKHIGFSEKEECFIAGLIHDIGKVILCQYFPEEFIEIVTRVKEKDILFYESEKELLDSTHQEIGGMVVERWNIPANLQDVVRYHHCPAPSRNSYTITAIVHCADILIRAMDHGYGGDNKVPMISEQVWNDLGMNNLSLPPLLEDIDDEIDKATGLMSLV
ncbi:MAG: HDOD domain-containing protein [Chitinivibrionales bacterium]|nr:HDOD domain-containing protein [Chitinivibrionales bacterium]